MKQESGQSVIELLVSISVFTLIASAIVFLVLDAYLADRAGRERTQATFLAEEGLEAARSIRDDAWSNLAGGSHGLDISENSWIFSGTEEDVGNVLNQGKRKIIIEDAGSDIKKVTSQVTWKLSETRSQDVVLASYLTNWQKNQIDNWAAPQKEAALGISGSNNGLKIQVQGNFAYLVRDDGSPDFIIVNIENPASPTIASSLNLGGAPKNIYLSGNYAYVASANNNQELQIIDIANPSSPVLSGFYNASGSADANGIYVSGETVYLARASSSSDEFLIINASNLASPSLTGSLNLDATAYELFVLGNYAYVASSHNSQELQVINISNPTSPALSCSFNLSGNTNAITISGFSNTIILGRGDLVYLFDVSTPESPSQISSFNCGATVNDLALGNSNNYLFLASSSSSGEFKVINISNPVSPSLLGAYNVADSNPLRGVAYREAIDRVFIVGNSNNEEFIVLAPQ